MTELPKCRLCEHPARKGFGDFAPKFISCSNAGCNLYRATLTEKQWRKLMQPVPDGFAVVPVELTAENGALRARVADIAEAIHYPDCWDTVAYPTLLDAIENIGCNECDCVKLEQSND